jgi:aconitate hydratase
MSKVESTPEMASKMYAAMEARLAIVRKRLNQPLTLADKILFGHLDDPQNQPLEPGKATLFLRPDRVVLQDVLGQSAFLQFMQTRRASVAVPTTVHCDHLIQARTGATSDLKESINENSEIYDFLKSAAAKFGAGFWGPGAGIIHQVVIEQYGFPAHMIIGTDSHTPNAGGAGACAVGVGGADAVETMAGLPWELLHPRRIAVYLTGKLSGWTAPKDVILWVAGQLTVSGGTNSIIEYIGPGARTISATGKATICNMGAEVGATTSLFPYDDKMAAYLQATNRGALVPIVEKNRHLLEPDAEVEANPEKYYERVLKLDLSTLEPYIVGPHSPDRARPLSKLKAELADPKNGFVDTISQVLIGSCTNSSYEDMSRAADVAGQAHAHGLKPAASLMVTPGSEQVRATIERDGQMAALKDAGAIVLANACGPCIGQWRRTDPVADKPNSIVTSYNRNFPGRNDERTGTMNFIASPEIAVALSLAGRLSFDPQADTLTAKDGKPFKLNAPDVAPEVPAKGFTPGVPAYVEPPADSSNLKIEIPANSERLQAIEPWAEWNGLDIGNAPVLMKTKGKTTTDDISPAGSWLRFRGHLGRFSDNLLLTAVNAYDGKRGTTIDVLSGERDQKIPVVARKYQAQGIPWVIVGDSNYGEGSSREHAALIPRLLGGSAVIARSFARIHESNLKKQGLLALTFSDPADYDKILEGDRVSLTGLSDLTPGKPVTCQVEHADGTTTLLALKHTFTASQIEWFRKGSALNTMQH